MKIPNPFKSPAPVPAVVIQRDQHQAEAAALRSEANELTRALGPLREAANDALNHLQGQIGRDTGRPDTPAATAARAEYRAAMDAEGSAHARLEEIAIRRAELEELLHQPLALSGREISAHGKALAAARDRITTLREAVSKQEAGIAELEAVPDPRPELATKRAMLQADVMTGDATDADLAKFDADHARIAADAAIHEQTLTNARAIAQALAAKLGAAQADLDALGPITVECRVAPLSGELEPAREALETAHRAYLAARSRFDGLADLLRQQGRTAPPVALDEPNAPWRASGFEAERMRTAHPLIF